MTNPHDPRTPSRRRADTRHAAFCRWATEPDRSAATAPARRAFDERFFNATDPSLPEEVRRKQAEAARRAHFLRLARRSAEVRSRNKGNVA